MDDSEAQKLYGEFIALQEQAQNLNSHLQQMLEQTQQIETTKKVIAELQAEPGTRQAWIPIAPGAYAKGTIQNPEQLLLNIGSGVAVEKTPQEVLETLDGHKKVLDELSDAAMQELKEISEKIDAIRVQVEAKQSHKGHTH